ncbi:hypothetical protein [Streptomyces sp. NRRL WC-3742]|uniref:hypothetical protein n=1 Tax=Streptomyces sp. NRRL WC-3742 TaxID=1463934 RepID=UPI00131CFF90|nr:hypothetical protein [Streptomyces sp. NRRL WC-3742]
MISRIRRWWHRRRSHRTTADAAVVVILLPHPPGPTVGHPAAGQPRDRPGPDEQRARAVLLTALGEHPAPGGDLR